VTDVRAVDWYGLGSRFFMGQNSGNDCKSVCKILLLYTCLPLLMKKCLQDAYFSFIHAFSNDSTSIYKMLILFYTGFSQSEGFGFGCAEVSYEL